MPKPKTFAKRLLIVCISAVMCLGLFACGGAKDEIIVAQREAGSGTRDAFESVFKIKDQVKATLDFSSTGALKTAVISDKQGIGYVSVGAIDNSVTAVKIDGKEASEANILSGDYAASRPFMMITNKSLEESAATKDFIKFMYSTDGQALVKKASLINAQTADGATGVAYDTAKDSITGSIMFSGSTSMEDVVNYLVEAYNTKQSGVTIVKSFSGSSAGKADVLKTDAGKADIGLVSSSLSEGDLAKYNGYKTATDGIAIIVNKKNKVTALTKEQIIKIFTGEIKNWSEIV